MNSLHDDGESSPSGHVDPPDGRRVDTSFFGKLDIPRVVRAIERDDGARIRRFADGRGPRHAERSVALGHTAVDLEVEILLDRAGRSEACLIGGRLDDLYCGRVVD